MAVDRGRVDPDGAHALAKGRASLSGVFAAVWGIGGVLALLCFAIVRLYPLAADGLTGQLVWYHWATLLAVLAFMLWAEGYRGFQLSFAPRVAARARHLSLNPRPVHSVLAPLFCIGYFHATPRRQRATLLLTSAIIVMVILVHRLPQPWRGIIDAGVIAGLAWGVVSVAVFAFRSGSGTGQTASPELP